MLTPLTRSWVGDMVTITAAAEEIEATGNHPFWVLSGDALASRPEVHELAKVHEDGVQGRWVEARHLRVGDWLLLRSGEWARVRAFSSRIAATYVYNATVANWHTYSVGRSGILVHNAKCPKKHGQKKQRKRRNSQLANDKHPRTEVPFDAEGFPDFKAAGAVHREVEIEFTGSRRRDRKAANEAAGIEREPEGTVWHHHQDGKTMQLVDKDLHDATGHDGGFGGH